MRPERTLHRSDSHCWNPPPPQSSRKQTQCVCPSLGTGPRPSSATAAMCLVSPLLWDCHRIVNASIKHSEVCTVPTVGAAMALDSLCLTPG